MKWVSLFTVLIAFLFSLSCLSGDLAKPKDRIEWDTDDDEEIPLTQSFDQELDDSDIGDETNYTLLSAKEVARDCQTFSTVRFLIAKTLLNADFDENIIYSILQYPVICIGTGQNMQALKMSCTYPTIVRQQDFTIDIKGRIKPHYIGDGLMIPSSISRTARGAIIFAHAGFGKIYQDERIMQSLQLYFDRLIEKGFFIYLSEVPVHANEIVKALNRYKDTWIELLTRVGFRNVVAFANKEEIYGHNSVSFAVIGQKIE